MVYVPGCLLLGAVRFLPYSLVLSRWSHCEIYAVDLVPGRSP
jgi:hypothetical protein